MKKTDKKEAENEIASLEKKLLLWQHQYYVEARQTVSDREYDRVFDQLLALEKEFPDLKNADSPTSRVGSDLDSRMPEFIHTIKVLSLDKAYSFADVETWLARIERQTNEPITVSVEEKLDGVAIVLYYEEGRLSRAVSRGNGQVGNVITDNVKTIGSVPLRLSRPVDVVARGEIFLPQESFEAINRQMDPAYANPRNLAAGTVRRLKSRETAKVPLEIFVYEGYFKQQPATHRQMLETLSELGFRVNPQTVFFTVSAQKSPDNQKMAAHIAESARLRQKSPYQIDGLVLKVDNLDLRASLGSTSHHPRWALAYKFEAPQGSATVEKIDVQVGRTGRLTPVARVTPVFIGGSTITNVTLHNQDYIQSLELAIGDLVAVSKRGDVIPAMEKVLEKALNGRKEWQMPAQCPVCRTSAEKQGAHHFCPNYHCPAQQKGRLFFFAAKNQMDIVNLGSETLEFLWSLGFVRNLEDIYTFSPADLFGQPGFGEKKIKLIAEGIAASRRQPFSTVLRSLGLPELGRRGVELLIEAGIDSMRRLLQIASNNDPQPLARIHGFGEKTAMLLIAELRRPEARRQIDRLANLGLAMAEEKKPETGTDKQTLAGQIWCVTGTLENFSSRTKAQDEIKKRGARVVTQVSKNVTHLLAGQKAGSKLARAREWGIEVVEESDFLRRLTD